MQRISTFTFFGYWIVLSAVVTLLAFIVCLVITLVRSTFNTPITVEEGFFSWTKHTSF